MSHSRVVKPSRGAQAWLNNNHTPEGRDMLIHHKFLLIDNKDNSVVGTYNTSGRAQEARMNALFGTTEHYNRYSIKRVEI